MSNIRRPAGSRIDDTAADGAPDSSSPAASGHGSAEGGQPFNSIVELMHREPQAGEASSSRFADHADDTPEATSARPPLVGDGFSLPHYAERAWMQGQKDGVLTMAWQPISLVQTGSGLMSQGGKRVLHVPMMKRGAEIAPPKALTPPRRRMGKLRPAWTPGHDAATM
ncbi:MAG: hypothetical protein E5Y88_28955 [Mesorhizobium sp.]|uniref:hypothetical protein n=1 Tax=Mesorhizobium sp. TaxID=1871066 RepID=UPI0011F665EF|nr:hypothetical protein [Mesorhizobium sp.]TIL22193.1 MAG: hypothetical protein E5Y88_28955 [Mesorhizobium sp.]